MELLMTASIPRLQLDTAEDKEEEITLTSTLSKRTKKD
jgi:hypothetical protein